MPSKTEKNWQDLSSKVQNSKSIFHQVLASIMSSYGKKPNRILYDKFESAFESIQT